MLCDNIILEHSQPFSEGRAMPQLLFSDVFELFWQSLVERQLLWNKLRTQELSPIEKDHLRKLIILVEQLKPVLQSCKEPVNIPQEAADAIWAIAFTKMI